MITEQTEQILKLKELKQKADIKVLCIGSWLWVVGNTYTIKEQLKEMGFFYSKNKKSWFFNGSKYKINTAIFKNLEELKNKLGYQEIEI